MTLYTERIIQLLKQFRRRNILLLGLGGGTIPLVANTRIPNCKVTAVDITRDSIEIVRQFVHPDDGVNVRYVQQSAEPFLNAEPSEQYDVVIEDMYDNKEVPGFIYNHEYVQNILRVLNSDGIFISNIYMPAGFEDRVSRSMKAVDGLFQDIGLFETERDGNIILVASKVDRNLNRLADASLDSREADDKRHYDGLLKETTSNKL
jgi:spermidine synthase